MSHKSKEIDEAFEDWTSNDLLDSSSFHRWDRVGGLCLNCGESFWTKKKCLRTEVKTYSDLYLWIDSAIHESLPSNYETLSPRELREHLASELFERITDREGEFQDTHSKHLFWGCKAMDTDLVKRGGI